ncbi:acyltransferase [Pelomonas sp. KK5]|uniref:acyltransferase family protein n=1 Tax=Pelomonas sp. KK5 TaxID=1855730 RepID=UPI00097C4014|nr:acyltransferase [Pelomonas sp. KK5]
MSTEHRNNFDLIRLLAAAQVLVGHVITSVPGIEMPRLHQALTLFPGVPIFFFISGYLISGSWLRRPDPAAYFAARALRIFPALWAAVLLSLALLALLYREPLADNAGTAAMWLAMQASFLQSWNPPFLRGYGTGLANPVLWTIPVELAFYVALPLLCLLGARLRRPRGVLVGAAVLSFAVFVVAAFMLDRAEPALLRKVLMQSPASFITWMWMFLLGALAQLGKERLLPLLRGRFPLFALLALATGLASLRWDLGPWLHLPGNEIGLLNALTIDLAVLSLAFSWPALSTRLLRGNDLSYGLYLFHMPVVNALIVLGFAGLTGAALAIAGAVACAAASWWLLERRALARKAALEQWLARRLRPVGAPFMQPAIDIKE